jgi:hypothetical protein
MKERIEKALKGRSIKGWGIAPVFEKSNNSSPERAK